MMETVAEWIAAAQVALKANDKARAIECLALAVKRSETARESLPKQIYFDIGRMLFEMRRLDEALTWVDKGLLRQRKDFNLVNLRAVALRNLGRPDEALACCREAAKLNPKSVMPHVNAGNILLDQREGAKAVEAFGRAVRLEPGSAEFQGRLGAAWRAAGDLEKAERQFRLATQLAGNNPQPALQLAGYLEETGRRDDAEAVLLEALEKFGLERAIVSARLAFLRRHGRSVEAAKLIEGWLEAAPETGWLWAQLGTTLREFERDRANAAYRKAIEIEPDNAGWITELADSLNRTRGPQEAENIAEAYELSQKRLAMGGNLMPDARALHSVLNRVGNFEAVGKLGKFEALGPYWARAGQEAALHHMMPQVETPEQRRLLVRYHRMWGEGVERAVAGSPIRHALAITGRAKLRVGFMSSDLRDHPVGYFAAPLLTQYDRDKFEFYGYSFNSGRHDPVEQAMAKRMDGFRLKPDIGTRDAAQMIADDRLDILFELGGSTAMNKIRVMAYRPAPRQASWLGYPHSMGLEAIDRILTDPYLTPKDPALLIEKPFELKRTWVALEKPGFGMIPDIDPVTPQERTGRITFGTMNNPYKYNPKLLETWAAVLRAVAGSRFLFVRPEGAVPAFVDNMKAEFEKHGVDPARIDFIAIRGRHMPHYNDIDVALDVFPQTGGTTTCETLWMGVPLVTLVGEGFYERLSHSNLNNAGLAPHCAFSHGEYVANAKALAEATAWRTEFRRKARDWLRSHPLGRPDWFIQDFQETLLAWMDEGK